MRCRIIVRMALEIGEYLLSHDIDIIAALHSTEAVPFPADASAWHSEHRMNPRGVGRNGRTIVAAVVTV